MGFLLIEFEPVEQLADLYISLRTLPGVELLGDWHDFRLESVKQSGLSLNSAPALSVLADKQKHGEAIRLSLALSDGNLLEGQIRRTGLLLSNSAVHTRAVEIDPAVVRLKAFLGENTTVRSVEVG